ncbi:autotransporter-associated beta strand protein/T5SS/PEP-CTERM-associated repeat protein [Phyllobacterium leguminum]|uniref:Autotransporter-associated beta strand protein/T5SS/PEP-CTERM-associated repeat protein n=1 Tax=Phyllobacterium leguminum TaxID=314237 RepID=A0A318TAU8_9HYPH|nr:autotransporter-associated beta strand protein/T5SS/PEP-CTERM-associated repeat protein [Phyllobacterium leguminum]
MTLIVVLASSVSNASAQVSWTGADAADPTNWLEDGNWSTGNRPTSSTNTTINVVNKPTVLGLSGADQGETADIMVGPAGNLTLQNGSTLSSTPTGAAVGGGISIQGSATVTSGATWNATTDNNIDTVFGVDGTLTVSNGGIIAVTGTGGAVVGNYSPGTATVTGQGSQWNASIFVIGWNPGASGQLNIEDHGVVTTAEMDLTNPAGSAILNINGSGVLATARLENWKGGAVQVNFDGGILRASGKSLAIVGFSGTELNIDAGGLTIDSAGFGADTDTTSAFTGAGALTKIGGGTLTLAANNMYQGGTFIRGGTVSISVDGNLGAAIGGITFDGGTLENTAAITNMARAVTVNAGGGTFETDADLTLSGAITDGASGTGPLTKSGSGGNLILTGSNTGYTGQMTIAAGELQVGNGGATGTLGGIGSRVEIDSGAKLVFNRSDAYVYDGVISGDGALTQAGGTGSKITLTGANDLFKGTTTISDGTLQVGDGGTSGNLGTSQVNLAGGALAFNRTDTFNFGNDISGDGNVEQDGSGITVLSGVNTYTGNTAVNAGTLAAGAANVFSQSSAFSVANGATLDLQGHDQTISSLANAGNVRLPGAMPGTTLTVTGDYAGQGGTVYLAGTLGGDNTVIDNLHVKRRHIGQFEPRCHQSRSKQRRADHQWHQGRYRRWRLGWRLYPQRSIYLSGRSGGGGRRLCLPALQGRSRRS